MNPTRTLALALAVSILAPALSAAAGLPTINPRLRVPDLNVGSYVKVPTFTTASLPKDFLDKSWLFGAMVEACTDNYLTLGEGAGPYKVRWTVEGDKALMVLDQRERVPSIGAGSQDVLNRYPMRENGDAVEIDLAHPEIMSLGLLVDRSGYSGVRPGYVYDLVTEPGYVSWGEKFVCQSTGGQDKPGQMTVAIKYFLKAATPSATFKPRVYPEQDTQRYGFFTTTIQQKQADGRWKAQDLADRWDLSKKIVYLLHPSIPQQYRETFRQCVLSWNKVFKRTNGVEPIECIDGKGTDLPGDLRCHVLYWVDYPTPYGNGAVGPSMSDPDTGEQLDGDVIFYADSYRDSIARLRHQAAAEHGKPSPEAGAADEKASPPAAGRQTVKPAQLLADKSSNPRRNRGFKLTCGSGPALTFTPTCERGSGEAERMSVLAHLDISTMTDEQVFTRMIQETVPHEIGHTLGLRHNFKATADLKNIVDNADSTSVMDYEIDLQALTEPGPYDTAAIAYGYEGDKSLYEGKDFFYATDESESTDPQSNQWDAGDVFEFYSARFAHFRKLRDAGLFSSPASYSRSQRHNLAVARKFVNRDEASGPKAFDFLLKVLATRTAEAPFDSAERLEAMAVLTDADPNLEPLDDKQLSKLAKGLSKSVAPVGEDDFDTRVAMLEALKAMNNIYGRDAIASLDKAFSQLGAKLPARERELALRVSQALAGYFGK